VISILGRKVNIEQAHFKFRKKPRKRHSMVLRIGREEIY
jgi:hypothetical protein